MNHPAKQDPLYETVKQLVIETKNPSVSHAQRRFKLGYNRAIGLIEAMEGEIVTARDENGWRSMLTGETNGRD
ncbi:DNA translocase FtsK [Polaromonas naphthalenivorans]|uniref:Cell division protein FtsK/SpoIIIE n=1 Tax=Polaromonas naphthalenivorans (strain CJ2) TaxID=365044 RepID=A1VM28_POLNA|nr:DNA translocase FtsK [Polaromonas naphthalenivorans]ABM36706.1 cell division protein FtsK/SpoIIIE [Polaromonas naphthalenivorans CJ2]